MKDRMNLAVTAILRRNNLRGTVIYVGQRLIIPLAQHSETNLN
jgi:LysM repeat protein